MPDAAPKKDVTQLLAALRGGQGDAQAELISAVYDELRRIAAGYMRRERVDHTLQATALVHEAYLQLVDQTRVTWQNRAHFFGVAAQLMRRILVDHARGHSAQKRGGGAAKLSLDEALGHFQDKAIEVQLLDDALVALAELDERQARIVELRFFGGLTVEETAEVLQVSPATVEREWRMAKAWLHSQLVRGRP